MAGEGVTVSQGLSMTPMMALGPRGSIGAMRDLQAMSQMSKDRLNNIEINIVNRVISSCPNSIGRTEYDTLIREVNYYKSTGKLCAQWERAYAQGNCTKNKQ